MTTDSTIQRLMTASEALLDNQDAPDGSGMSTEELMQIAEEAPEPGGSVLGDVVHEPAVDSPFGMTLQEVQSAGYVLVWDKRDGEVSMVNRNMLRPQLEKRDPETGDRVFTTDRRLAPVPKRGSLLCMLHADHPERNITKGWGLLPAGRVILYRHWTSGLIWNTGISESGRRLKKTDSRQFRKKSARFGSA